MTYSPNIPVGSISPQTQAPKIQTNFSQFASIFSSTIAGVVYNHTAFNLFNQGDHESIIMTPQTLDPGVEQDLVVLYAKNATSNIDTQPQLFLQIPKFLPNNLNPRNVQNRPMQLTYNTVNTAGPIYQSFLPGGYLLYFGQTNTTGNIVLSPVPSKIVMAIAYANNFTFDVRTNILSKSTFRINSASASGSFIFTWIAIGIA